MRTVRELRLAGLFAYLASLVIALLLSLALHLLLGGQGELGWEGFNAYGLLEGLLFLLAFTWSLALGQRATRIPCSTLLTAGLFGPLVAADRPPNIIFVLADDLGWTDVGCFGSKYYETPNLDRLAAQGMRLTNHHHCQNCAPTRSALLSGQYGARTGTYTVGSIDRFSWQTRSLRPVDNVTNLSLNRDTFANQLKAAGYATAMFGKWHLGGNADSQRPGPEFLPHARGFDYFYGFTHARNIGTVIEQDRVCAQVAAKPDQTAFVRFVHAPDVSCTAALGTARRGQRKISLWPWISNRSTSRIIS